MHMEHVNVICIEVDIKQRGYFGLIDVTGLGQDVLVNYRFLWRWGRGKVLIDKAKCPAREQKVEAKQVKIIKNKTKLLKYREKYSWR